MRKREWNFPYEIRDKEEVTERIGYFLEGYAMALSDVIFRVTGDSFCNKSYDPMIVDGDTIHSYAFDMKDGGRHHRISDYRNVGEILDCLLEETIRNLEN